MLRRCSGVPIWPCTKRKQKAVTASACSCPPSRPLLAPGVISSVYITGTAVAQRGAAPLGVADLYAIDDAHLAMYAKRARSAEGFQQYLDEFVWQGRKSSLPA